MTDDAAAVRALFDKMIEDQAVIDGVVRALADVCRLVARLDASARGAVLARVLCNLRDLPTRLQGGEDFRRNLRALIMGAPRG